MRRGSSIGTRSVRCLSVGVIDGVVRDLFGVWLVEVKFGRIGARGRTLHFTVDDEQAARRMVRERLQRRARALGRIGVAYRTESVTVGPAQMDAGGAYRQRQQGKGCIDRKRRTVRRIIAPVPTQRRPEKE